MTKYKIYEDYLMKTLDYLPSGELKTDSDMIPFILRRYFQNCQLMAQLFSAYLHNGSDSSVMPIIRRHETLSFTHQELQQRLGRLEEEMEQGQRQLQTMKQKHSIKKLVRNA